MRSPYLIATGLGMLAAGLAGFLPGLARARMTNKQKGLEGMGVSVRTLNHTQLIPGAERYDGAALAAWCTANGVRWVELLGAWTHADGRIKTFLREGATQEVCDELRRAGVRVGVWGWPDPVADGDYMAAMERAVELTGAEWLKHDPEGPYTWTGPHSLSVRRESARRLMRWSTKMLPTDVTTYGGGPASHPLQSFPWEEWSQGARYGRPQWYDRDSDWSEKKAARFADSWREYFPVLCPVLSAVNTNTPAQMLAEADKFIPLAGGPAYSYWDLYWLLIDGPRTLAARKVANRYG